MAIKGQLSKENLMNELLNYFGDRAFRYDKDIRVNIIEEGQSVQIKMSFTVSKVAVEPNGDVALPGADNTIGNRIEFEDVAAAAPEVPKVVEPTAEEKKNIADLLASIGL